MGIVLSDVQSTVSFLLVDVKKQCASCNSSWRFLGEISEVALINLREFNENIGELFA